MFLNPLDVATPIWRCERLDPAVSVCPFHAIDFNSLPAWAAGRSPMACKNLDQLLRLVSRREQELPGSPLRQPR